MSEPGVVFLPGVYPVKPRPQSCFFVCKFLEMRYFGLNLIENE